MSKGKKKKVAAKVRHRKKLVKPRRQEARVFEPPRDKPVYRKAFWGLSGFIALLMMLLSLGSGINEDDKYQVDYSEKLVSWYTTFGKDDAALQVEKGNMHYYGGFFDLVTGLANHALGFTPKQEAYHNLRHLFIALLGFLGLLFTALLGREMGGWRLGIIILSLGFLSPRYLGHSLMNPKDIPFAAGVAMALYFLLRWLRQMPKPDWRTLLGLAGGIGLAFGVRAGGLILFGYVGLFALLEFVRRYGVSALWQRKELTGKYILYGVGVLLGGFVLGLLFWPYGMQSPIAHTREALSAFAKFGTQIRVLFEGKSVMSDDLPWYYPLSWIYRSIPMSVFIGFVAGLVLLPRLWKRYDPMGLGLALFAFAFPLVYVIAKDSVLYDGWRHLIFVYPGMLVFAGTAWLYLIDRFREKLQMRYALLGIFALSLLEPAWFIARNYHYPYVYFNPLAGGISHAFGRYETDYWGVSVRQAVEEMEKRSLIPAAGEKPLEVVSSFWYNASLYLRKYGDRVHTDYVRYNDRFSKSWDYGIFPSRYLRGPHLLSGNWPSSRSIATVNAQGVPLTAIYKAGGEDVFRAAQAVKSKDWATAIPLLQEEVKAHPDNEWAWQSLAMAYLNSSQPPKAKEAAEELLKVAPDNLNGLYFLSLAELNTNDLPSAEKHLLRAIEVDPEYAMAYFYLAIIHNQTGDTNRALDEVLKSIKYNPKFPNAYELAAQIYEKMGDSQTAARYRKAAQGGR